VGHPLADAARALVTDASETIARMRQDARHLAELAQRAKIGAEATAQAATATFERAADEALDRLEQAFAALRGK
jgi:hypothetical protein